MNTDNTPTTQQTETPPKQGFFASLLGRLDRAMKESAEKKAAQGCGCSPTDGKGGGKGGKCC